MLNDTEKNIHSVQKMNMYISCCMKICNLLRKRNIYSKSKLSNCTLLFKSDFQNLCSYSQWDLYELTYIVHCGKIFPKWKAESSGLEISHKERKGGQDETPKENKGKSCTACIPLSCTATSLQLPLWALPVSIFVYMEHQGVTPRRYPSTTRINKPATALEGRSA